MGLLREVARHWVPLMILVPVLLGTALVSVNVGGVLYQQYWMKVAARKDAAARYAYFCGDPKTVYETNYGSDCRKHLQISQSIPLWEAATATAATYTTICDPHHGCGGIVMAGLCVVVVVLVAVVFVTCKFATGYQRNLAAFNAAQDENFFFNAPAVVHDPRPRGREPLRIVELKQE